MRLECPCANGLASRFRMCPPELLAGIDDYLLLTRGTPIIRFTFRLKWGQAQGREGDVCSAQQQLVMMAI